MLFINTIRVKNRWNNLLHLFCDKNIDAVNEIKPTYLYKKNIKNSNNYVV